MLVAWPGEGVLKERNAPTLRWEKGRKEIRNPVGVGEDINQDITRHGAK